MGLWVLIGMLQPAKLPYLRTMLVGDRGRHLRMGGGLLRSFVAYGILSMSPPAHGDQPFFHIMTSSRLLHVCHRGLFRGQPHPNNTILFQ